MEDAAALHRTGLDLLAQGRPADALRSLHRAAQLRPNDAQLQYDCGTIAGQLGAIDLAIDSLRRATELSPQSPEGWNNLGQALCERRDLDGAMQAFRHAIDVNPDHVTAHNNLVYTAHFHPSFDGPRIRAEAEAWARTFADPLTPRSHAKLLATGGRRLRIGYVSPDLFEHPVGRFMQVVVSNHDRERFEVYCYSDTQLRDHVTEAIQRDVSHWRETGALDDAALAEQVRRDGIDVLVDLSLHMGGSRLLAFARRPAPVQVTYLAYAGTSGMRAMDYRLTDPHLDPPGNDAFYTERSIRLARTYWCYPAPLNAPDVIDPPMLRNGFVTFGCLNNLRKVSDAALESWAEILSRVPKSRLILHSDPGRHVEAIRAIFTKRGVSPDRLSIAPWQDLAGYLRLYNSIDVALDSFPYAGGTTTCDAAWMGVPTVTLAGQIAVHRGGVSIMSNLGLPELIAGSSEAYERIAVELASDADRLTTIRRELRDRMRRSPLMDGPAFARDLEAAYVAAAAPA